MSLKGIFFQLMFIQLLKSSHTYDAMSHSSFRVESIFWQWLISLNKLSCRLNSSSRSFSSLLSASSSLM